MISVLYENVITSRLESVQAFPVGDLPLVHVYERGTLTQVIVPSSTD